MVLYYTGSLLAVLSGAVTAGWGLLALVTTLDDTVSQRFVGWIFGVAAIALGGMLMFFGAEIWP